MNQAHDLAPPHAPGASHSPTNRRKAIDDRFVGLCVDGEPHEAIDGRLVRNSAEFRSRR